jgi:hypothetical protein
MIYRRTFINLLLLSLLCAATPATTAAHTFHTSLMSMEYNRQEQSLEISVRVFSHDLEAVLTRRSGKSVRLDRTPDAEQLTFAYVQQAISLTNGAGEAKPLAWVGMESKADIVWLYFEIKMPEGLAGAQLRNRILFDLLDDQVNLVHLKDAGQKSDLVFKPGDGFKPLYEKPNSQ